jgi:uncharacterized protein
MKTERRSSNARTILGNRYLFSLRIVLFVLALLVQNSCATYYQKNQYFNTEFEKGKLENALKNLEGRDGQSAGKTRFIYFANRGLLLSVLGRYEESNAYFEKAFLFGEDYHRNYVYEAASYFYNPNIVVYRGEDHEHLMVLYFKALNFLKLQQPEQALIECRRLNIRLNQLSDKYSSDKKFQRDAFIHNLMGIIYQSSKDYNNAFIAYRNALEIYESDYARLFSLAAPDQLKLDLMNTAKWTGFEEEFESYRIKFNMPDYTPGQPDAELVFFWHNGLAPVKAEWNINFFLDKRSENMVIFTNDELGIAFPFKVDEKKEKSDLASIEMLRVAFPKYKERAQYFQSATIIKDSAEFKLQLAEDINQIAFTSLRQRMMLEFSKGLLRAAMKKATEYSVKKEDDGIGALLGMVNAITEKADTRNWQTLPHSIYYTRVPLNEGQNNIRFSTVAGKDEAVYKFTYQASKGQTLFHTFSSLESSSSARAY